MTSIKGNSTSSSNQLAHESNAHDDSAGHAASEHHQESLSEIVTKFMIANSAAGIQAQMRAHLKETDSYVEAFQRTANDTLPYNIISGPFGAMTGCIETWKVEDSDGDGWGYGPPYGGDCVDVADTSITYGGTRLKSADINPGATETWYDGVDQDCSYNADPNETYNSPPYGPRYGQDGGHDYDADGDVLLQTSMLARPQ